VGNPNDPIRLDTGKRVKRVIRGENFYFYISPDFVCCTVPRENDPRMTEIREIVEAVCDVITEALDDMKE
jgi:hypothetical protein